MPRNADKQLVLPPLQEPMSHLFQNLRFLLLPNNSAGITKIRSNLARNHDASITSRFIAEGDSSTTHVLVDTKVLPHGTQVSKKLIEQGFPATDNTTLLSKIPILSQDWLVDSVAQSKLQPITNYKIDLSTSLQPSPLKRKHSNTSPSPNPGTPPTKSQLLEALHNHDIVTDNPNWKSIHLLSQMAEARHIQGSPFKEKAYKTAIDTLSRTKNHITSYDEALKLPGVGPSIARKIEEIAATDTLEVLKQLNESKELRLMKLFKGIYGVGDGFAQTWIKQGLTTLDDVRARDDLGLNQRLGLKYYDEWNEKIPRRECKLHDEYVTKKFKEISPETEVTIGGSYRRGADYCGDIDFIVTKKDADIDDLQKILNKFMEEIKKDGYYRCALTSTASTKWLGSCALTPEWNAKLDGESIEGKARRVDFLLVPWQQIGAALIYFTGNNEFNKKIRLRASKMNMSLSGQGLFKIEKDQSGKVIKQELVESFSEKKIFDILGMQWLEPRARNIGADTSSHQDFTTK